MKRVKPAAAAQTSPLAEMSTHELDRLLDFVGRSLDETEACLGVNAAGREMRIMVQLMRSHLRGRMETPSSLIAASGLARGTAHRAIEGMIADGLIDRRPRTKTGKTFSLHPSERLIRRWLDYSRRMKSVVGGAFGMAEDADYFFGASYLASAAIPPLPVRSRALMLSGPLRMLLHADPAFLAMQKLKRRFELHFGIEIEVRALSLDRLRAEILENTEQRESRYDIVTSDVCWMAEMIERGAFRPIEDLRDDDAQDVLDFHPEALSTVRRGHLLYGLPVQTTPELLVYRTDLLEARGVAPPETLDALLHAARALHDPAREISGICWNGAPGTPLGTTFAMLMADFGRPLVELPAMGAHFGHRPRGTATPRPALDSDEALAAAEFLIALQEASPPNVLQMSWFERARCYADGRAAMAYCYTQIMPMFDSDPTSPAHGRTGMAPHPAAAGRPRVAPLGGWNLCVPANLRADRFEAAAAAARTLTSAPATKLYIENGSLVSSRFSVCNDPAVAHGRPLIPFVDRLARTGAIRAWPRPAVPEFHEMTRLIGAELHQMLQRNKRMRTALRAAQARCDRLLARRAGMEEIP